jgi:hypothetical protein
MGVNAAIGAVSYLATTPASTRICASKETLAVVNRRESGDIPGAQVVYFVSAS